MTTPGFIILYVANPSASAAFYAKLLQNQPVESSPGFALFVLENGLKLGLWKQTAVQPAAQHCGGGGELAFTVENRAAVDALHADWINQGIAILQPPTHMDFGYTFTGQDPDGHRLRVFETSGT